MRSNFEITEGFEPGGVVKVMDDNSFEIVVGVQESFTAGSEFVIGDDDKL